LRSEITNSAFGIWHFGIWHLFISLLQLLPINDRICLKICVPAPKRDKEETYYERMRETFPAKDRLQDPQGHS
jgi:hypothetical protein